MNRLYKAIEEYNKASFPVGCEPQSEAEWNRLQEARKEFGYALCMEIGMSASESRKLAERTHGGLAGRRLLEKDLRSLRKP